MQYNIFISICVNIKKTNFLASKTPVSLSNRCKTKKADVSKKKQTEDKTLNVLVKRAQHGNADSFIRLIEENKQTLMRVAYGFFHNEEDVADAIQETIADAYEHIRELKKPEYFKTWLVKILINNCNRLYNQNRKSTGVESLPEIAAESSDMADVEFAEMIGALPEEDRTIFQLYYGENFTTKEIAEVLHKKESTVKSRLHRGKEKIRSQMRLIC